MSAFISESTQFVGINGKPLVNGKIYIGVQNLEPVANPVSIFSNRALTIVIANPQTLNSLGQPTNKIWIAAKYSIRIDNSANVQQFLELDNGEDPSSGITTVSNVQGTNAITGNGSPTITAYADKRLYIFKVASTNTGAVTLNLDNVGAKAVTKNNSAALISGDFVLNQNIIVVFNSTNDEFEWVDQTEGGFVKGADIASASPLVIGTDGSYFDVTGTTNFSTMTVAKDRLFILQFDGILTITDGAPITIPGSANFTTAAGDILECFSIATNTVVVTNIQKAPVPPGTILQVLQEHVITTSQQSLTAVTRANITGLNKTITLGNAANKVMVTVRWAGEPGGSEPENIVFGIKRDTTDIGNPAAAGSRPVGIAPISIGSLSSGGGSTTPDSSNYSYLDTPGSVGPFTYHATVLARTTQTLYNQRSVTDSDLNTSERLTSSVTLEEIRG